MDAIKLLKNDHREVEAMFRELEAADGTRAKTPIARRICDALTAHTKIEEKLFYPAVRKAVPDEADGIDEAIVEHATLKSLIRQIRQLTPTDDLFDAKLLVLKEYVQHHVKEEEKEMMPAADGELDLDELGERMAAMKRRLLGDKQAPPAYRNPPHNSKRPRPGASAHA